MRRSKIYVIVFITLFLGILFLNACRPVRNFMSQPAPWSGGADFKTKLPTYDPAKKTVMIVADPKLTEIFDMLAPFYLFNTTGMANVFIVAKEKTPILIKRDLFLCPQLTFKQADSMGVAADVIVIPALSIRDEHQDTAVISWIRSHTRSSTKMLTICDGASTGAATGFYDGKSITCHATDFETIKKHFGKPVWVQNVSVAQSGNAYSTAGVSNAVDGSLAVINELFGSDICKQVATDVRYPHQQIRISHESIALKGSDKFAVAKKVFFRRNRDIGVLLENGINEIQMAGLIDTYGRSFPASFKTYTLKDSVISTKYGLSLIHTGNNDVKGLDELHVLMPEAFSKSDALYFKNTKLIAYENLQREYLFDVYLKRIETLYGHAFAKFVKVTLDYN